MLHPELGHIQQKYDELVESVEKEHISFNEAIETLNSMVALDASGFEWRIDADGNFTKAFPGQQPVVADPKTYSPPGVTTGSVPAPGGWGTTPGTPLGSPPSYDNGNFASSDLRTPPFATTPQGYDNSDHTGMPPQRLENSNKGGKFNLPNIDFKKKKTLIIVGASVIIGILLLVFSVGGRESEELTTLAPSPTENTVIDIPLDGSNPDGSSPSENLPENSESVSPESELIPMKTARSLVKILQNGKLSEINKYVEGDWATKLEVTGFLDAAKRYKATIKVVEVVQSENGSSIVIEIKPKSKNSKVSTWLLVAKKEGNLWYVSDSAQRTS